MDKNFYVITLDEDDRVRDITGYWDESTALKLAAHFTKQGKVSHITRTLDSWLRNHYTEWRT